MKKILTVILILAIVGGVVGYKIYNKPHENMSAVEADLQVNATDLLSAFEADEAAANEKYLDKKVEVSGKVLNVEKDDAGKFGVTFDAGSMLGGVICKMDDLTQHHRTDFKEGEEVTFKCICTGMLMDVVLERCVEVNK